MKREPLEIQIIGLDIGRGYSKGYTEYKGTSKECLFKSVVAIGRDMNFENYDDPIYLEVNKETFFAGTLAEVEGDNPTQNLRDDKTTNTVKKLMFAALNKIVVAENVEIMLGVPKKIFTKSDLVNIQNEYKGLEIEIKDKITGAYKKILIKEVSIFREGDAALIWHVRNRENLKKTICMVNVGFRTTEVSCYDRNMKFIDKLSKTIELGNKTALDFVQRTLAALPDKVVKKNIEIDTSNDYDDLKEIGYKNLTENIEQEIEGTLVNLSEFEIFICGGTALKLKFDDYNVVEDSQMITAKGLYKVATTTFK